VGIVRKDGRQIKIPATGGMIAAPDTGKE